MCVCVCVCVCPHPADRDSVGCVEQGTADDATQVPDTTAHTHTHAHAHALTGAQLDTTRLHAKHALLAAEPR